MNVRLKNRIGLVMSSSLMICLTSAYAAAQEDGNWYVKPALGVSLVSDTNANTSNVDALVSPALAGTWDIETDSGFYAGIGLGYEYKSGVRTELYWEYRTNDSSTTTSDGNQTFDGNLASSIFYINAYYPLYRQQNWLIHIGAGLGWVQEIDLDLERDSLESSFSGDNEFAYQLIAQTEYQITSNIRLAGDLRWIDVSSPSLKGEENALGEVDNIDYNPLSIGLNLQYRF